MVGIDIFLLVLHSAIYFWFYYIWTVKPQKKIRKTKTAVILFSIIGISSYNRLYEHTLRNETLMKAWMSTSQLVPSSIKGIYIFLIAGNFFKDAFYIWYFKNHVREKGYLLPHFVNLAFSLTSTWFFLDTLF